MEGTQAEQESQSVDRTHVDLPKQHAGSDDSVQRGRHAENSLPHQRARTAPPRDVMALKLNRPQRVRSQHSLLHDEVRKLKSSQEVGVQLPVEEVTRRG